MNFTELQRACAKYRIFSLIHFQNYKFMHSQARQNDPALITKRSACEFSEQSTSRIHTRVNREQENEPLFATVETLASSGGCKYRNNLLSKASRGGNEYSNKRSRTFPFEPKAPSRQSKLWSFGFRNEKLSQLTVARFVNVNVCLCMDCK
ncbi:hypothetical protein CDAR_321001 [Caerostris darwini]|uniref:Uncharacterized protein n=1 Tax=Caerostris darwini TaxID=1538125 RepID=A0AAV4WZT4_9ARAC|nr:hypothetical protein CDAR_321001 [Caerostris darwini]